MNSPLALRSEWAAGNRIYRNTYLSCAALIDTVEIEASATTLLEAGGRPADYALKLLTR